MKICKVDGCNNKHFSKGHCSKHYRQVWVHGKVYSRTRFDKNEYIDKGDYYEVCLYSGLGEQKIVAKTIIDKSDYNKVSQYKWFLGTHGYVRTNLFRSDLLKKGSIGLHQIIMGAKAGLDIDHINNNPLDNRKKNLRIVTHQQNMTNRKNVRGVHFCKRDKLWVAYIGVNNKKIYLGYFRKEEDAIAARKNGELKYFIIK